MPAPKAPALDFQPRLDKIVELLIYLAQKRPGADQYQAVKFFYLADREHLARYGRPITFDTYYALDYGPVASNTLDLIKEKSNVLKAAGTAHGLPVQLVKHDKIIVLRGPRRAPNMELFSKSDIAVFDEVLAAHGNKTFDELYRLTHAHFAYDHAWKQRGDAGRALMDYADMLEESGQKDALLDDIGPISSHMR